MENNDVMKWTRKFRLEYILPDRIDSNLTNLAWKAKFRRWDRWESELLNFKLDTNL